MALNRPSVVIADDHAPSRALARRALEQTGFAIVGEAATAGQAVSLVIEHRPDVALLDIRMPGDGIGAARRVHRQEPQVVVVMLTVSTDSSDVYNALRAGASGYIVKGTDPESFSAVLRAAIAGEASLPISLLRRVLAEFVRRQHRSAALEGAELLSDREWEVLELLAEGMSTGAVAEQLFVAKVTVRSHVASVLRKLRVEDRASAVALIQAVNNA